MSKRKTEIGSQTHFWQSHEDYRIAKSPIFFDSRKTPQDNTSMQKFWYLIATLGGIGRLPKAPGTWATFLVMPLVYVLLLQGPFLYMTITFFVVLLGIFACNQLESTRETHDDSDLVIDELAGILITMTWLPITWQSFVFSGVLFRLLDIFKPFPVNYLDRRIKGGLGVMLDDVAAGIIANIILQVVYAKTNWLGSQLVTL